MYDFTRFFEKRLLVDQYVDVFSSHIDDVIQIGDSVVSGFGSGVIKKSFLRSLFAMRDCGSFLEFSQCSSLKPDHDFSLHTANFCKSKFCPYCVWTRGLKYSFKVFQSLNHLLSDSSYHLYFLTLTLKNTFDPLEVDLDRLTKNFFKLRRLKWFSSFFSGGYWTIETTCGKNGYHPHMHVMLLSSSDFSSSDLFSLQKRISSLWLSLTSDSFIVHLEAVYSSLEKAVVELAKYPFASFEGSLDMLVLLYPLYYGKRLFGSFGVVRSVKDSDLDDLVSVTDDSAGFCCSVCSASLVNVRFLYNQSLKQYFSTVLDSSSDFSF